MLLLEFWKNFDDFCSSVLLTQRAIMKDLDGECCVSIMLGIMVDGLFSIITIFLFAL